MSHALKMVKCHEIMRLSSQYDITFKVTCGMWTVGGCTAIERKRKSCA